MEVSLEEDGVVIDELRWLCAYIDVDAIHGQILQKRTPPASFRVLKDFNPQIGFFPRGGFLVIIMDSMASFTLKVKNTINKS